jgi:hypothetical protein
MKTKKKSLRKTLKSARLYKRIDKDNLAKAGRQDVNPNQCARNHEHVMV